MLVLKPMLAETLELDDNSLSSVAYPVLASPKLDGIRCLKLDGRALSRKFLDIPNEHIRKMISSAGVVNGCDGELMTKGSFNDVQSGIMSEDGIPNFQYYVFDYVSTSLKEPYSSRIKKLEALTLPDFCVKVLPKQINNKEELLAYEKECLDSGHEGVMIRKPDGPYKCGRSTVKEAYLLKVKRFKDSEALVIGFEEMMHNENEAIEDELGHTKRSKCKANMVPANTLGKFLVREVGETPWRGREFAIGTGEGLTADLRKEIWGNRSKYLGKLVVYKYQVHGIKDLPRIPTWKGFRDPRDL
jgi:DNA ligase-1